MDKALQLVKILMYGAAVLLLGSAATVLIQVSIQLHKTPNLMLKVEATVDYVGRSAKNFDDATKVWKEASQTEADYLHNTLPVLTKQVQTNLTNSNALLVSLKNTSDTVSQSANTITTQTTATLATTNNLLAHTDTNLQPVLTNLSNTSLAAQTLISDPAIKGSLINLQETSANVAVATKESAQILKDGRIVADKYVQPERWFIKVLHYTLQGGSLAYDFIR
jgi:hypothetical protein